MMNPDLESIPAAGSAPAANIAGAERADGLAGARRHREAN